MFVKPEKLVFNILDETHHLNPWEEDKAIERRAAVMDVVGHALGAGCTVNGSLFVRDDGRRMQRIEITG